MLKRVRWCAMLGALVLVTAACDWSMVGFDTGRRGFNVSETKITPANIGALTERWRAAAGTGTSPPVVGKGRLFVSTQPVGTTPGGLSAFDAAGAACSGGAPATCAPIWSKVFASPVPISPPLLTDDYVSADGYYEVEEPFPLAPMFTMTVALHAGGSFVPASGAVVAGETRIGAAPAVAVQHSVFGYQTDLWSRNELLHFYYVRVTRLVASVPAAEGTSFAINGPNPIPGVPTTFVGSAPAVANGRLFVSAPGELRAYDAHGSTRYCSPSPDYLYYGPPSLNHCSPIWTGTLSHPGTWDGMPAVARGRVFAPALDGAVEVFAAAGCGAATCAPAWTAHAGSAHLGPVAVTDDRMFAASDDGHLYAFRPAGCGHAICEPSWSANLGSAVHAPSVAGSVLFTGSEDGHLYAFNAAGCGHATCAPLWTGNVGAPIHTAPVISDGRVFVTDTTGTVHAFTLA